MGGLKVEGEGFGGRVGRVGRGGRAGAECSLAEPPGILFLKGGGGDPVDRADEEGSPSSNIFTIDVTFLLFFLRSSELHDICRWSRDFPSINSGSSPFPSLFSPILR